MNIYFQEAASNSNIIEFVENEDGESDEYRSFDTKSDEAEPIS